MRGRDGVRLHETDEHEEVKKVMSGWEEAEGGEEDEVKSKARDREKAEAEIRRVQSPSLTIRLALIQ